jgi:hypothetical protein
MRITMVGKIRADGTPCPKCVDVGRRLEELGLAARIDHHAVADERDEASEGMRLAREHDVHVAPFFIVEHDDGRRQVYTVFMRFVREVLAREAGSSVEGAQEALRAHPELNFI